MESLDVVMVFARNERKFLMLEKSRDHGHPRYDRTPFETAGGKIEDETVEEAALRELQEETGLDGEVVEKGSIREREEEEIRLVFHPVSVEVESRDVDLSREHDGYAWLSPQGVRHVATTEEVEAFEELFPEARD